MQYFVGLLLATTVALGAQTDNRISIAAMNGDTEAVRSLLQQGADINGAQGDGTTALHWAAFREDVPMARMLLNGGAKIDVTTRLGEMTPLFMAAKSGNAEILDLLVKAGADAASASTLGTTALMLAAASGSADAVKVLLGAGAPVNARDVHQGQTALMFAAASGRAEVIRVLAAAGAELDAASLVPTRLPRAAPRGAFPARQAAQDNDAADPADPKPQAAAASTEPPAASAAPAPAAPAALAARRAAEPEKPLALGGMTAMQFAAREGHMEAVRAMVESGADVNAATV